MAANANADIEEESKRKVMKIAVPLLGGAYLLSSLVCTYLVAMDVDFNPVLGGTEFLGMHFYSPFAYSDWKADPAISAAIPDILNDYKWYRICTMAVAAVIVYFVNQAYKKDISHGSASFATNKDITEADLGHYVTKNGGVFEKDEKGRKIVKKSGVVVGRNPYNKEIMLHDGPEHILLMAPTRSGKGINTIIPTGLVWKASIFFFDPKGELWAMTSGYRKQVLKQKVMKFEPLCIDGSANRWNPLAEINFRTNEEISDVSTIVSVMVKPDGEKKGGGDPFWDNSASNLLNGVIMHLMYKHYKEELPLPSPTDIMSFLSSPDKDTDELFEDMMTYPHITPEEFLEREHPAVQLDYLGNPCRNPDGSLVLVQELDENGKPKTGSDGKPVYRKERYSNPLRAVYGEYYVRDLKKINDKLSELVNAALSRKKKEEQKAIASKYPKMVKLDESTKKYSFRSMAKTISEIRDNICWAIDVAGVRDDNALTDGDKGKLCWAVRDDDDAFPFHRLLTHPRVAEQAATMKNGAEQTRASIMQTAQTALGIYGDPVVQRNMSVSDFCIRDLLDPRQEISCYLVMQVKDIATVRPIARLFINTILNKLIRDMKFEKENGKKKAKKQRLLLMLDEFPQLGNMQAVELALAICAGYGIKMCIVCQDVNQLNKEYTKDNSIASNCHVHIYFTPNLDPGGATAEAISKTLGKKTIKSISHSDGGGLGKGSNSISSQARELMTPDEVARMSTEEELVFVAGHKPIRGGKLRYYLEPWFTSRLKDPPKLSDQATRIETYGELFKMHEADTLERRKKVAEIEEEKRKRAEMERKSISGDASSEEKVPQGNAPEENPKAPQEEIPDAGLAQEKESTEPAGAAQEEQTHEESKETGEDAPHGEEHDEGPEHGQPEEAEEAPDEGPRRKDTEPVRRPGRVPHDKRLDSPHPHRPFPHHSGRHEEEYGNERMDSDALESKWLRIENLRSAIRDCCESGQPEKAMALFNAYLPLNREMESLADPQKRATLKRHARGLRNLVENARSVMEERMPASPPAYQKPKREGKPSEIDAIEKATADAVAEEEAKTRETMKDRKPDVIKEIGTGFDVYNNLVDDDKEKEGRPDGTGQ